MIDVDYTKEAIRTAIEQQIATSEIASSPIYGDGEAGEKIANILATCPLSYHKTITY